MSEQIRIDQSIQGTVEATKQLKSNLYNFKRSASHYCNSCTDDRKSVLVDKVRSLWADIDKLENELQKLVDSASNEEGELRAIIEQSLAEQRVANLPSTEQIERELALIAQRAIVSPDKLDFIAKLCVDDENNERLVDSVLNSREAHYEAVESTAFASVEDLETCLMLFSLRAYQLLRRQDDSLMHVLMHGKVSLSLELRDSAGVLVRKLDVSLIRERENGPTISMPEGQSVRIEYESDGTEKERIHRDIKYSYSNKTVKWSD